MATEEVNTERGKQSGKDLSEGEHRGIQQACAGVPWNTNLISYSIFFIGVDNVGHIHILIVLC